MRQIGVKFVHPRVFIDVVGARAKDGGRAVVALVENYLTQSALVASRGMSTAWERSQIRPSSLPLLSHQNPQPGLAKEQDHLADSRGKSVHLHGLYETTDIHTARQGRAASVDARSSGTAQS